MAERKERLVVSILEFLEASIADGTVSEDDKDGVEVAIQCIGEAFGVDATDEATRRRLSVKPATLPSIFDVYMKTREKMQSPPQSASAPQTTAAPSAADKAAAEKFKAAGNAKMTGKDYPAAIEQYTQAIALDSTNPVFFSNRAAAYSSSGDHEMAIVDAEKAIAVDPKFIKAYHRLGHAHYSIGAYESAANAFQKGLDIDPQNMNLKSAKENALARIVTEAEAEPSPSASRSTDAAPNAGAGGGGGMDDVLRSLGGGAGGMDFAGMMQNPALMNMAQQMMANGGLENLMRNPAIGNMMERLQSGGGMPSMDELMNDPTMREMAESMRGSGLGRGAGAPPP